MVGTAADGTLANIASPVLDVSGIATVHEANTNTNLDSFRDVVEANLKDFAAKINTIATIIRGS